MVKKFISVLMIIALPMGFAGTAFSAQDANDKKVEDVIKQAQVEKEERCTVTKIDGTRVNLQNDKEKQFAMNITDPKILQDLKVGDRVVLKNGKVTKEKEE